MVKDIACSIEKAKLELGYAPGDFTSRGNEEIDRMVSAAR